MRKQSADFKELPRGTIPSVGLVIRVRDGEETTYERITHVFSGSVYVMEVRDASYARYAKRPRRWRKTDLDLALRTNKARLGRKSLPPELATTLEDDSPDALKARAKKRLIKPLIEFFETEANLDRGNFTQAIRKRAKAEACSEVSLRRLLFRWWYFGGVDSALFALDMGPPASSARAVDRPADHPRLAGKRSGARSPLEEEMGPNEFVASADDIEDMVAALKRLARKVTEANAGAGVVTMTAAHYEWLHHDFKRRHRALYSRWMKDLHVLPMSESQYRRYVKLHADLDDKLASVVPSIGRSRSGKALIARGPGEVYELDATGGQIVLIAPGGKLFRPVIYIIIDRWSRFIVSIFVSLRPCSWEVLRIALRIAFTSRERRFNHLGIHVDDVEWPIGVVPAKIFVDRGAEMISEQMLDATVEGLRIVAKILPPLTPDGKGIVERVIGVLKKKMKGDSALRGQYHKFITDPKQKGDKKRAAQVAISSLAQLYRALIEIVLAHNNTRLHSSLKKMSILKKHGVKPRPRDAYLFGLKEITGIERPPLTDEDYAKLTLWKDTANLLADGSMSYRSRSYRPANAAARRYCELRDPGSVTVKVDQSEPYSLYIKSQQQPWPEWTIDQAGARDLRDITMEEQIMLAHVYRLGAARAANDALRGVPEMGRRSRKRRTDSSELMPEVTSAQVQARRRQLSDALARSVGGAPPPIAPAPAPKARKPTRAGEGSVRSIEDLEAEEAARIIEANRARRKR
jgi:putative transposase